MQLRMIRWSVVLLIVGLTAIFSWKTASAQPPQKVERVEIGPLKIDLASPHHAHPTPPPPQPQQVPPLVARPPMKATIHDGHFAKNTFVPEREGSFLVLRDYEDFDAVFGSGAVMGARQNFVTKQTFKDHAVIAIIRDGLWTFDLKDVEPHRDGLTVKYSAQRKNQPGSARFVSPLVFSVPDELVRDGMDVQFIENGRPVSKIKVDRRDMVGGWAEYRPLDHEAKHIFERAVERERLERFNYQPLLCATQVVAGLKYRFVCVSESGRRHQKESVAVISVYVNPQRKIESVKVAAVPIED